jgi:hypothetical protein
MLKFGMGATVKASVALWLNDPWDPCRFKVTEPRAAEVAADNVMETLEPTPTEKGDCGDTLMPVGSPLIATLTFPVKPLTAATLTLSGELAPCANEIEVGLAARVKSPAGADSLVAGVCVFVQLASESSATIRNTKQARRFGAVMKKFLLRRREDRAMSAFHFGPMPKMPRPVGQRLVVRRLPLPLQRARPGFEHSDSVRPWLSGTVQTSRPLISSPLFLQWG